MTDKLSRRSLLKMAAALVSSGALAWKLPALKVKAYYILSGGTEIAATEFEPIAITEVEQPFAPYFLDPHTQYKPIPEYRNGNSEND